MPPPILQNYLFRNIYCPLAGNPGNAAVCASDGLLPAGWEWLAYFVAGFAIVFLIVNVLLVLGMLYIWTERRVLGRFQSRLGPNRWGPWGLLTPIADAIKMLTKEDIVPRAADRLLFNVAPVLMVVPVFLTLAVVPFAHNTFLADLNIAVLFVPAVGALTTLAIFTAGWSSSNRYALFGAMRGVAQLISYEIPVVLALAGVVVLAGSMSLTRVVEAQGVPYLLVQPLGAFIFLVGASAEMNRTPFDIVEAESEIIAGYHIEYSGMKWGLFQLAEFAAVLVSSALLATLYLGGWSGPFASGQLGIFWFFAKVALFTFLFIWVRATLPRLRVDQIMAFAWKFLFPLSLVNLFVVALEVYLLRDPSTGAVTRADLWVMVPVNLLVTAGAIAFFTRFIRDRKPVPRRVEPQATVMLREAP